MAKLRA